MKYTLYFKGIEKTEAIENYLDKKIKNLHKLVHDDNALATVELAKTSNRHKQGDLFRAEINLSSKGKDFYVASEKEDLYAAIDDMRDEIMREITKFKGKSETVFRRSARGMKNMIRGLDPRSYNYNYREWKIWKKFKKGSAE